MCKNYWCTICICVQVMYYKRQFFIYLFFFFFIIQIQFAWVSMKPQTHFVHRPRVWHWQKLYRHEGVVSGLRKGFFFPSVLLECCDYDQPPWRPLSEAHAPSRSPPVPHNTFSFHNTSLFSPFLLGHMVLFMEQGLTPWNVAGFALFVLCPTPKVCVLNASSPYCHYLSGTLYKHYWFFISLPNLTSLVYPNKHLLLQLHARHMFSS